MNRSLEFVMKIARQAGERIRTADESIRTPETKEGVGDYVTQLDRQIEESLVSQILEQYPDDQILAEESHTDIQRAQRADNLWIIDPIDGTSNFVFGRNFSAVSIAYLQNQKLQYAVVFDPFSDELYAAELGAGATCNGTRITLPTHSFQNRRNIGTDNSYQPEIIQRHLDILRELDPVPHIQIRGAAAITIAWTAAGKLDAYFSTTIRPWDKAAGILIAREAGVTVETAHEGIDILWSEDIIVGRPEIVADIRSLILK